MVKSPEKKIPKNPLLHRWTHPLKHSIESTIFTPLQNSSDIKFYRCTHLLIFFIKSRSLYRVTSLTKILINFTPYKSTTLWEVTSPKKSF